MIVKSCMHHILYYGYSIYYVYMNRSIYAEHTEEDCTDCSMKENELLLYCS